MELSLRDIRRLFLNQQGLLRRDQFGRGKRAVLRAIRRKSYLQIDTISVVRRAHEHILSSRVANFAARMLHQLHDDRHLYEYWGHAAAYLPFEHFRYSLPVMEGFAATRQCDRKLAREILARIRAEGAMQSRDFEDSRVGKKAGWWDWKPAKRTLEHLFLSGELMIARREGFQKVFDLPERVVPDGTDTRMPSQDEWCRHMALAMTSALGAGTSQDLAYALPTIRRLSKVDLKKPFKASLQALVEEGCLVAASCKGDTWYSTSEILGSLPIRLGRREIKILSPFDNLVINRRRLLTLF
ncbi:MAG: DNA glycosylase AlkZ-like family protein, partial [Pseudomonadales bacterium]